LLDELLVRSVPTWRFLDAGRHSLWKGSSCRRL